MHDLATGKNPLEGGRSAAVPHRLIDVSGHRQGVSFDTRRQNRHSRFQDAGAEVLQGQGEVRRGEVQVNTLLGGDRQVHALF